MANEAPKQALQLCTKISDTELQQDCQIAAIEKLAKKDPLAIKSQCPTLTKKAKSECYFIAAEHSKDATDCEQANEFEFAKNLGANASSRRRHIKTLQEKKQCIKKPEISISIGVTGSL